MNVARSKKIVKEVWARNQDGKVSVDWMNVLADFDWEIILA